MRGLLCPLHTSHRHPQFLPDGHHFLFYAVGTPEAAGIYLGSLDGGTPTRLTAADSRGAFLPPDQVVFVRQGTLVTRRLDLADRVLTGDPITLADQVGVDAEAFGAFAVSGAGSVAYRADNRADGMAVSQTTADIYLYLQRTDDVGPWLARLIPAGRNPALGVGATPLELGRRRVARSNAAKACVMRCVDTDRRGAHHAGPPSLSQAGVVPRPFTRATATRSSEPDSRRADRHG